MGMRQTFKQVADIIGDGAKLVYKGNTPIIVVPGKGRYVFGSQADRCYCWANEATGKLSHGFTFEPSDVTGDDAAIDEIADDLTHLIEDEAA